MLASSIPAKFPIAWGAAAGSAYIRTIPMASQIGIQPGAASWMDGFPPVNLEAIQAGGTPPWGQDMNGIVHQITLWSQWHAAGGPLKFDATFAAAIGGYPAGALVQSNSGHAMFESLQDNNLADPNTSGVLWRVSSCVWSATAIQAGGSANFQTITLSPAPASLAQMVGIPLTILSQGTNTGPVTINPNGLGALPVQAPGGVPLAPGMLTTGAPFTVTPTPSAFILSSPAGRLMAALGAFASGNPNVGTILGDFQSGSNSVGWWTIMPSFGLSALNAIMIQGGVIAAPANGLGQVYPLPRPFPTVFAGVPISYGGIPPTGGTIGAQPSDLSHFFATNTSTGGSTNNCSYVAFGW